MATDSDDRLSRIRIVVQDIILICVALLCGHLVGRITRRLFEKGHVLGIRGAFDMQER